MKELERNVRVTSKKKIEETRKQADINQRHEAQELFAMQMSSKSYAEWLSAAHDS